MSRWGRIVKGPGSCVALLVGGSVRLLSREVGVLWSTTLVSSCHSLALDVLQQAVSVVECIAQHREGGCFSLQ